LNALRVFESAGRHLNFRVASEELGVTHSAVAQQVRGLEEALGIKLFERSSRSLSLSESGKKYLIPIQKALKAIAEATEDLRPNKVVLTISVTPSFAAKWMIPRLPRFTDAHPDIEVQVLASNGLANFQNDGVDLAVRQLKPPFASSLQTNLLFPVRLSAVCSPSLLPPGRRKSKVDGLSNFVLLHDAHDMWPTFLEKAGSTKDITEFKAMKFSHESFAIDAAASGQGVALASETLVESDLSLGRLCRLLTFTLVDDLGYYVVAPRAPRKAAAVNSMRAWLLSHRNSNDK
jgi:LysR family glycine cleavage system transcriptional activator